MKIVVWNCHGALDKKFSALMELSPDLAVIPECPNPDLPTMQNVRSAASSYTWSGLRESRGLGVLAFGEYKLDAIPVEDREPRFFLPIRVSGPCTLNLLAVWTRISTKNVYDYAPAVQAALDVHARFIASGPTVLAGDFNTTKHSLIERAAGVQSAYHLRQGKHKVATHVNARRGGRRHLDYVFVPSTWRESVRDVQIGDVDDYIARGLSDHAPVTVALLVPPTRHDQR
jgi:endonuclease/exonuclease/phosphatase (EEP) superfamily protein YafD